MIVMILLYVMTTLIKLSYELFVPFSEGYDTSLADISENDFKDTPQVKWRKKKRKKQDLCNCCDHKFTALTSLKAHDEVVHEGVKYLCDHCDYQFNPNNRTGLKRESFP
jgi:hypothetical protein